MNHVLGSADGSCIVVFVELSNQGREVNHMTKNDNGLTMKQWLAKVDVILEGICGLGHADLADFPIYDMWSDGANPREGAESALEYSDFPMEELC
mgnify:FL=1